jgi:hypothetical protein
MGEEQDQSRTLRVRVNMRSKVINTMKKTRVCFVLLATFLPAISAYAQSELNLSGVIDMRAHSGPDSVPRAIDADDLARLAKKQGMRGVVLKSHWDSTAALAYEVSKQVPGVEVYGGIVLDKSVGGINLEAVKRMAMMKGGLGRVVWLPTEDSEVTVKAHEAGALPPTSADKSPLPVVKVSENGHLLPSVLELIDYMAKHPELVLETGHISGAEALMVIHEAHERGVKHIVATGPYDRIVNMSIPQMQQAAREGAYIEFAYNNTLGAHRHRTMSEFAEAIRKIGPEFCILSSDFGSVHGDYPMHPQAMLDFMTALRKEGFSVADINRMAKTNPALVMGLKP